MGIKNKIKAVINKFPYIKSIYKDQQNFKKNACFPAGHFYSPIVNMDEIKSDQNRIWNSAEIKDIEGIDLNTNKQLELVKEFENYYEDIPYPEEQNNNFRYYFKNGFYSYTDAIFLYSALRHFKPKQIIEVGSGFSSSVMLDTNEMFFNNKINLTFIEPYPNRLNNLLKEEDKTNTKIIVDKVQNVSLNIFKNLNSGDILLIDSTHVAKTGSDVNFIIFNILPCLKKGVIIHFHDIFFPFEYPKEWVLNGYNWNEDYFIKAFLMYNKQFEIKLFADFLHKNHSAVFKNMPLCYKNSGGNLWIQKT
ncbi:MAG: class I SAM-dependent methyltransferase [Polaribacter sp.]